VQVVFRASDEDADDIAERLADAVCVPPDHDGPCATPWSLVRTAPDDLDEPKRSEVRALLDGE
jgi:hypothetical protein